jgi:hypothetical protein
MRKQKFHYDERVLVDFYGDGNEVAGEIDAIDFKGNPEYPYRVWYDTPRIDDDGPIECEWVSVSMLRRAEQLSV